MSGPDSDRSTLRVLLSTPPSRPRLIAVPGLDVLIPMWPGRPSGRGGHSVPPPDPSFVFDADCVAAISGALLRAEQDGCWPVLLVGPAGIGKTQLVLQLASVAQAPVTEVSCHADTRVHDLFGLRTLRRGEMVFEDGPVTRAFREGRWLLLDEVSLMAPGVLQSLHRILDGAAKITLESGEVVSRAPGFMLFATSNTMGSAASQRHRYAGNQAVNEATLSRFTLKLRPGAPSAATVRDALLRRVRGGVTVKHREMAQQLGRWFIALRERALGGKGDLRYAVTLRELIAMWEIWQTPLAVGGQLRARRVLEVARHTLLHAFPEEEGRVAMEMLRAEVEHLDATQG